MGVTRPRRWTLVIPAFLLAILGWSCPGNYDAGHPTTFDVDKSDARAVEIARATLESMGGRSAWDETRYLTWNYMGRRHYVWDKHTGRVRMEFALGERSAVVVWATHDRSGRAWIDDEEITDAQWKRDMLDEAHENWVNDSYWLVMPYKLLDAGVVLKDGGEGTTLDGAQADVLDVTFEGVGLTPQNRYLVYVGRDSGLVEQWDVFGSRDDSDPRFRTPWRDWRQHGSIWLAGDRGDRKITDIAVLDEVDETTFSSAGANTAPSGS